MSDLSKAARWVILRQWIYFALTKSEPMRMSLDPYITVADRHAQSDEWWCNQAVLRFARVLESSSKPHGMEPSEWRELQKANEQWFEDKPTTFLPIWNEPVTANSDSVFPVMWCCEEVHLVGLQHYHLSRTVLAVFDPDVARPGFDSFRKRRLSEVRNSLLAIPLQS